MLRLKPEAETLKKRKALEVESLFHNGSVFELSGGSFVRVRNPKNRALGKVLAEDLHADRKFLFRVSHGNGNSRNARKVGGYGVNVGEIHGQRVVHFFAELERRRWTCRRNN